MIVVPQSFLQNKDTKIVLRDGLNCIIYKEVNSVNENNDRHLTTHAITYVISGKLRVETPNGLVKIVNEGEAILLPKGLYMISDIIPDVTPFKATVFFFDQDLLGEYLKSQNTDERLDSSLEDLFIIKKNDSFGLYTSNLIDLYGSDSKLNSVLSRHKIAELLHLLSKLQDGHKFKSMLYSLWKNQKLSIKKFMDLNYDKPLKIEDYAHLTGRSISSFHRDFKRYYNVGPKKWLIEKRLKKATELLDRHNDISITAVAFETGYENLSNFIKAFSKKYGISPKQYQMNKRNELILK